MNTRADTRGDTRADSRVHQRPPLRVLCQHEGGSCAACCGLHNFKDRSSVAEDARLRRRTTQVQAAWPDVVALAAARDALIALERPDVLFAAVKVCPFAGYVEEGRVGCLLHPSRHPHGEDLRDLAVYPREVCAGHFCAPHAWLRPREMDLAQAANGTGYSRVVSDAGLVKALAAALDERLARSFTTADVARARPALTALWEALLAWPWRDGDPTRFGAFRYEGDDAVERSAEGAHGGLGLPLTRATIKLLDALGTRRLNDVEACAAIRDLDALLDDARRCLDEAQVEEHPGPRPG